MGTGDGDVARTVESIAVTRLTNVNACQGPVDYSDGVEGGACGKRSN